MFLYLFVIGAIFGLLGVAIARPKGISLSVAFFLGALLGPIGILIIAVMSANSVIGPHQIKHSEYNGPRDLSSDSYRIWLTSRYEVSKNEVLGGYTCLDNLFSSADEAIEFASQEHGAALLRQDADEIVAKHDSARRRKVFGLIGIIVFLVLAVILVLVVHNQNMAASNQRDAEAETRLREAEEAKVELSAQRNRTDAGNRKLAVYGFTLPDSSVDVLLKRNDSTYCSYVPKGIIGYKNVTGTSVSYTVPDEPSLFDLSDMEKLLSDAGYTTDNSSLMYDSSDERLLSNKKRGYKVIVRKTFNYEPGYSVNLCFGR